MGKTKVKNQTGFPVSLKVYSSGIQTNLLRQPLGDGQEYTIRIDTNATYREYWCAANPGRNPQDVILSSDDCAEFSEVTLKADKADDGSYTIRWEGSKPRSSVTQAPASESPANANQPRPVNTNGPQGPPPTVHGAPRPGKQPRSQRSKCTIL
ncbi:hypothetical protein M758_10G004400 [Ceratodon purpureus]|uniref:DUF7748 domain-containing protein n=1 Tax=Ceratodon purpureus TaxID=3225 RepID=A0A8T0GK50_CERPU|nr:hypothetical protein KC19_10G004600 [Ceratodon purpureus]KAG0602285.1 hypothetical protein M758_10G004400 [Ceratodon purpureus]